jgi:ATP adenylyltransferase
MEYIRNSKASEDGECLFCRVFKEGKRRARENLVVAFRSGTLIMMNRYPYSNGHLMVVPEKHRPRMTDYSKSELADLIDAVRESEEMLTACFRCEGLNVGMNLGKAAGAGIADHLHVHLVPRWTGDTNYMTVTGEIRVIPQHIDETYKLLRRFIAKNARRRRP